MEDSKEERMKKAIDQAEIDYRFYLRGDRSFLRRPLCEREDEIRLFGCEQ